MPSELRLAELIQDFQELHKTAPEMSLLYQRIGDSEDFFIQRYRNEHSFVRFRELAKDAVGALVPAARETNENRSEIPWGRMLLEFVPEGVNREHDDTTGGSIRQGDKDIPAVFLRIPKVCEASALALSRLRERLSPPVELTEAKAAQVDRPSESETIEDGPSPCFSSFLYNGKLYEFTPGQRGFVELLWKVGKSGRPVLNESYLLENAQPAASCDHVKDVFRNNAAWGVLLVKGKPKDTFRLACFPYES